MWVCFFYVCFFVGSVLYAGFAPMQASLMADLMRLRIGCHHSYWMSPLLVLNSVKSLQKRSRLQAERGCIAFGEKPVILEDHRSKANLSFSKSKVEQSGLLV